MTATVRRFDWWVQIDRAAEDRWRASCGQTDIDAWCAAHGWAAPDVVSDSVVVVGLSDGTIEVNADLVVRDDRGLPIAHEGDFVRQPVVAPYRRPLPEGIAPIHRAPPNG